ncbi:response regulator transcription factor [Knoellia locipacati]|uniref:response regulator transcription factor n=1 Tax=Knoellia locipacati TaxID=882824 RepID=UPI00384C2D12
MSSVERTADGESVFAPGILDRIVTRYLAGAPPPEVPDDAARLLSAREREVLGLVGAGLDNGEIAARLQLSPATVKSHVRHILAKLDLRDRIHAVLWAHSHGLTE